MTILKSISRNSNKRIKKILNKYIVVILIVLGRKCRVYN